MARKYKKSKRNKSDMIEDLKWQLDKAIEFGKGKKAEKLSLKLKKIGEYKII